ncbi:MAG: putative ABC transporter ATP-binding protein YxlF [Candidatus Omnitrophica bacterium ADurb.Bin277]|nr:MAG: putative ABC transporter ATP-binding protein YxlF [Candidatus Omnitrophica bacterium ADurb.Bin277]
MLNVRKPRSTEGLVRFESVTKTYGRHPAVENLSFEIARGEVVGFLGPNGAGKTTAMRILAGYFAPTAGHVKIDGMDLFKEPQKTKRNIGYLPEVVNLYPDMRVREYLAFVSELKGVPRRDRGAHIEEKVELCGLGDVSKRLIGRLSKGYRQRVGLAQALVGDPSVLILDEPTTGLDPKQISEIRELIRHLGKTRAVILSTHILPEVSMVCNRVIMIHHGKVLASGTVRELEACLRDREAIFVTVGGADCEEPAERLLSGIRGVENVRVVERHEKEIKFCLETSQSRDLRPEVSEMFVRNAIPLLEVSRDQLTLEEIFLKLLKDGWFQGGKSG